MLCRMHKDVHQAELRLEVALHNKQLAEEEATAAAAGQAPQVCYVLLWACMQALGGVVRSRTSST